MGRSRYTITEPDKPHFMTCTIMEWLPLFVRPYIVDHLLNCWRYQQMHQDLKLYGYVFWKIICTLLPKLRISANASASSNPLPLGKLSMICETKALSALCNDCASASVLIRKIGCISCGKKAHTRRWCTAKQ